MMPAALQEALRKRLEALQKKAAEAKPEETPWLRTFLGGMASRFSKV